MAESGFEPVIGLEVHAQLRTRSKAFCGCSTVFGTEPNVNVCPICLGMPGTLPVLNRMVVEYVLRLGLALDSQISHRSSFARKNYFYPDLPKGYQISQFEEPICRGGHLELVDEEGSLRRIGIIRIHMEEDAGKSIHDQGPDSLVDVNRCGVPLIEIVTEPDIRSPKEAAGFLSAIRQLVTYLGICDGNMEEGSLRCDANVSVRRRGEQRFGTKTELKNMNSFRNVERALEFEIGRQVGLLEDGQAVVQETLLWDPERGVAASMRSKEEAHDYRYFPDPDLLPVVVREEDIEGIRAQLPELPAERLQRFSESFALPAATAAILTSSRQMADYFEAAIANAGPETVRQTANWIAGNTSAKLNTLGIGIEACPVGPAQLRALIDRLVDGTLSAKLAKEVDDAMWAGEGSADEIIEKRGLKQITDVAALEKAVDQVLAANARQVEDYRAGKQKAFNSLVGQVMKATRGKANPAQVNEILRRKLG